LDSLAEEVMIVACELELLAEVVKGSLLLATVKYELNSLPEEIITVACKLEPLGEVVKGLMLLATVVRELLCGAVEVCAEELWSPDED